MLVLPSRNAQNSASLFVQALIDFTASLLIPSSQNVARNGIDHIMGFSPCGKRVRQIIIDMPSIRAKGERNFEPRKVTVGSLSVLMGNPENLSNGQVCS